MSTREISDFIYQQWKFKLSKEERDAIKEQAKKAYTEYIEAVHEANKMKSKLKQEIHDIKFSNDNPAVKPSGKLKYMSAYRFFRRDMVPIVKEMHPDFDGKSRQHIIRGAWKKLPDENKFAYV